MIYHVYANRSNAGDWLSALGIQALLAPNPVAECLCDTPFVPETLGRLEQATSNDVVVIGGGGLLMDYFLPFWEGFLERARRAPFCLWGVGCCDMKWGDTRPARALLKQIASRSQLCVVRDGLTREVLSGCGCTVEGPVACPSFAALGGVASGGGAVLHSASYEEDHPEVYEQMRLAAEDLAGRTARVFRETNNRLPASDRNELDRIVRSYASSDVVLSARLHGCIIAAALGKKVLAVSSDHKIESFMEAAGLGEWVLDYTQLDGVPARLEEAEHRQPATPIAGQAVAANRAVAGRVLALCGDGGRRGIQ